jgi:hypothetical protein
MATKTKAKKAATAATKKPVAAKKVAAAKKSAPQKQRQQGSGVLDRIEQMLTEAQAPGITVDAMVQELRKATGRDANGLAATAKTQLTRMQRTRGLVIAREKIDGVMHYTAKKKG